MVKLDLSWRRLAGIGGQASVLLGILFYSNTVVYASKTVAITTQSPSLTASESVANSVRYSIRFSQFTPSQISQIQTFMRQYSGYQQQSLVAQSADTTDIEYTSTAQLNILLNNIQKTNEYLGFTVLTRSADAKIEVKFIRLTAQSLLYKEW